MLVQGTANVQRDGAEQQGTGAEWNQGQVPPMDVTGVVAVIGMRRRYLAAKRTEPALANGRQLVAGTVGCH